MPTVPLSVSASNASASKVKADILVVAKAHNGAVLAELDKSVVKELTGALDAIDFAGKAGSAVRVAAPKGVSAKSVAVIGVGEVEKLEDDLEKLRQHVGSFTRGLDAEVSVAFAIPTPTAEVAAAITLGAMLGAYRYNDYVSEKKKTASEITVITAKKFKDAVEEARVIASGVIGARDLVNQPPLDLYPETFANRVSELSKGRKVKATVYDAKYLEENGYGGLHGVGRGSARGPRLVKLEYSPKKAEKHLALVGKGITFDSGGLSLKPAQSMEEMKSDMGGAAAAAHTLFAVADLGLNVKVTAWLCLAENMPDGNAQRPSDVVTILGGKTVEITNTDAEGRLVLADGLVAAQKDNPDVVIDIATLTGAQIVALGKRTTGVMGTEVTRANVCVAADESGEQVWPMPFPEEIREQFRSATADMKNSGTREGGMLAAGIFLKEFIEEGTEWAHIDIAGPSFTTSPWGYTLEGGTGVPVRTLIEFARSMSK